MFIKMIKIVIALSMFVISVGLWRYQGDIHHMHKRIFQSKKIYREEEYLVLWQNYSKDSEEKMEMKVIHLYDFLNKKTTHPSEIIMNEIINSKEWSKFIPNSKSSTYRMSQKIWMSQNLTIYELMGYLKR